MQILRFNDCVRAPHVFHLARGFFDGETSCREHTHDFAELFWIESGKGEHHINGQILSLKQGDAVLIRPHDAHGFRGDPDESMTIVNLAFSAADASRFQQRYGNESRIFDLMAAAMPPTLELQERDLDALSESVGRLMSRRHSQLALDRFLLNFAELHLNQTNGTLAGSQRRGPDWLETAIAQMALPENLGNGASYFAGLAYRSHEHVARVLKAQYHMTPTELIHHLRLDHASQRLLMSDDEIFDVASESGYRSIGSFYKRFKERFGVSPRRYRVQQRALI